MQLTNWLKILAVCTADPETRRFPRSLARTLSTEEVQSLLTNFTFLTRISGVIRVNLGVPKGYHELQEHVDQLGEEMKLWEVKHDHIYLPNSTR